ncbi:MAG: hypothetical protein KDM64_04075 [Verrucomicrobiae bacterium]|nr:hypothetical protein [Verrucomicrobiae bacterium]MCB1093357.1 hypothetical protein [Verrucomicrobiae bacterium]
MADSIFREKVIRARSADLADKFLDGFRLFESALEFTHAGVADDLGTLDENEISREILKRFEVIRLLEEDGLYLPVATS